MAVTLASVATRVFPCGMDIPASVIPSANQIHLWAPGPAGCEACPKSIENSWRRAACFADGAVHAPFTPEQRPLRGPLAADLPGVGGKPLPWAWYVVSESSKKVSHGVFEPVSCASPSCACVLARMGAAMKTPHRGAGLRPEGCIAASAVWALTVGAALCLAGCSPALNWRTVPLGDATVTLPCKPDRAQRTVQFGGQALAMEMVGCEADGAMFAVSRVRLPPELNADQVRSLWQAASLQQMKGQASSAMPAASVRAQALRLNTIDAAGQGGDGRPLKARLAWVARGADLLHLAVYAPRITPEMVEPFFDGIQSP